MRSISVKFLQRTRGYEKKAFKGISSFSSGGYFVQRIGTVCAI